MHTNLGNVILFFGLWQSHTQANNTSKACKHGFIRAYLLKIGENQQKKKAQNALNSSKQRIESLQGFFNSPSRSMGIPN